MAILGLFLMLEWNRLIGLDALKSLNYCVPTLLGFSVGLFWTANYELSLLCLVGASVFNVVLGIRHNRSKILASLGVIYIFLPCVCVIWIREYSGSGLELMLWLFIVICTTDTGAYFLGKMVGGPRLAPKISPGKTWAGLIGGISCAGCVGTAVAILFLEFLAMPNVWLWAGMAILIAGTAQIGDLAESWLKRQMSVKDSGKIIPGHGGLLDRLDGYMLGAPVFTIAIIWMDLN